MSDTQRRLVTVREIAALDPIPNADLIEVATVEGWKLVVKRGEFAVGDLCVYFEIDSWLPASDARFAFLMKGPRTFEGVEGAKLRTIKLRGQVSQGLALMLTAFPEIEAAILAAGAAGDREAIRAMDFTELLGVRKWEAPVAANMAGQAAGSFPSFIQKTDQERCQNLGSTIFGYETTLVPFDASTMPAEAIGDLLARGVLAPVGDGFARVYPARASRDDRYEVTVKLDGSSMTGYVTDDGEGGARTGVCSRNLELKVSPENEGNSFVSTFLITGLEAALRAYHARTGRAIAVQGELMGPGIQGNREGLNSLRLFVYDVYDIKAGAYLPPAERVSVVEDLHDLGAQIFHVPVLHAAATLGELGVADVAGLLALAEGPSLAHKVREGLVFKRVDGKFSFKAISNSFLLAEKD
jgi:hypothetical protein